METDKEFDKIFRSKLDDFEAVPSANVWSAIEDGLNAHKRKITIVPFLGIAASLLILISAGLLFIPHQTKTGGKHLLQSKVDKASQHANKLEIVKNIESLVIKPKTVKTIPQQIIAINKVKQQPLARYKTGKEQKPDLKPAEGSLPTPTQPNKQEIINPVIVVRELPKPVAQPADEKIIEKPVLAAAQLPVADEPVAQTVKPKHKIKNFGDLINAVVGKVDKRKDKLIEFTDTDDDESTITGINLGVLKIKKEK